MSIYMFWMLPKNITNSLASSGRRDSCQQWRERRCSPDSLALARPLGACNNWFGGCAALAQVPEGVSYYRKPFEFLSLGIMAYVGNDKALTQVCTHHIERHSCVVYSSVNLKC